MTAEGCIDGADVATGPLAAVLKGPAGLTGTAETAGTGATTPEGETDRVCAVIDPDGYVWSFGTNVADFDPTKARK